MKVELVNNNIKEDYTQNLLKERGIQDFANFVAPDDSSLQTWEDLCNINKGIQLIADTIYTNGTYVLIVDCDVDGYTSSAIIYQYLKRLNPNKQIDCILHEKKQHGLEDCWEDISMQPYEALIIPDAGSNDRQYIEHFSCPALIIDHHILEDSNLSSNTILINNQTSPKYRNKFLSGAGMVYQFCRGLDSRFNQRWADDYLDLAALGICADMMSGLEVENQYIWRKGFSNITNTMLLTLVRKQGYSLTSTTSPSDKQIIEALTPTSIAFYIAPLINAMIRMGTIEEKHRLFLGFIDGHSLVPCHKRGAKGTMEEVAIESTRECVNAKDAQKRTKTKLSESLEIKIMKHNLLDNQILFIKMDENDDDFPSELNGLIAMELANKYQRPTIVARLNEKGEIKGSIRGCNNSALLSFKNYLESTHLFEYVQGHDNAAGCCILNKNLPALHKKANIDLQKYNFGVQYYRANFERTASSKDLPDLIFDIDSYKFIWSQQNSEPLIHITHLYFNRDDIQVLGRNCDTLKITCNDVSYMKFFGKDIIKQIQDMDGDNFEAEVIGTAKMNYWRDLVSYQIFIQDIEIKPYNILEF